MSAEQSNPTRKDYAVSMLAANFYGLVIGLPILLLFSWAYTARWTVFPLSQGLEWTVANPLLMLGMFMVGIVAHEWLHGVSWALFGRLPFSEIKLGFQWKSLTPYAHVSRPIEIYAYRLGVIMPGLLIGFLPYMVGWLGGSPGWMMWGTVFTFAAYGDFLVFWLIRSVPRGSLVEDHPTMAGCSVVLPENNPHTEETSRQG